MSYDSWLTYNPAMDGGEQDLEMYYSCDNDWPADPADPKGDWIICDFADYVDLPDTWVSVNGIASGEFNCPACKKIVSFEFEVPGGGDRE